MRRYQKQIKEYRKLIQKNYIREASLLKVIAQCEPKIADQEDRRISYFEFVYEQSRYIEKQWDESAYAADDRGACRGICNPHYSGDLEKPEILLCGC